MRNRKFIDLDEVRHERLAAFRALNKRRQQATRDAVSDASLLRTPITRRMVLRGGLVLAATFTLPSWIWDTRAKAGYWPNTKFPNNSINVFDYMSPTQISNVLSRSFSSVTDVSGAINNAVTAAQNNGGARIYLPAGWYLCSSSINIMASNVYFMGDGPGSTVMINGTTSSPTLNFAPSTKTGYGGAAKMSFVQSTSVSPTGGSNGILVSSNMLRTFFEDLDFPNAGTGAISVNPLYINMAMSGASLFINRVIMNTAYHIGLGINPGNDVFANAIDIYNAGYTTPTGSPPNTQLDSTALGIFLNNVIAPHFTGCNVNACAYNGWSIGADSGKSTQFGSFTDCMSDDNGQAGSNNGANWLMGGAGTITDLKFVSCWGATQGGLSGITPGVNCPGWLISGSGTTDIRLTNCTAINNQGDGFQLNTTYNGYGAPSYVTFDNCTAGTGTFGNGQGAASGYGYNLANCSHGQIIGGIASNNLSGQVGNNSGTTPFVVSPTPIS